MLFSCGAGIPQIYLTQQKAFAVSDIICLAKNTAEPPRPIKIVFLQQQEVLCGYKVLIVVSFFKCFPLFTLCYISVIEFSFHLSSFWPLFVTGFILHKWNLESTLYFYPQLCDIFMLQPYSFSTFHKIFTFTFPLCMWYILSTLVKCPLKSEEVLPLCSVGVMLM